MNVEQALAAVEQTLKAGNTTGGARVDVFVGEPIATTDGDGRAHPYLAVYPGPGQRDAFDGDLTGQHGSRLWRFQITAAGGDVPRCLRAMQRAQATLVGVRLDDTTGLVREDGDIGQMLVDRDVNPSRVFVPLLLAVQL